jgi:hypothetical protein
MKAGIEDILAMRPRRTAIVDHECNNDLAGGRFSVRNVFTPKATPGSVATRTIAGVAPVAAAMSCAARSLIGAMIGRRGDTFRAIT